MDVMQKESFKMKILNQALVTIPVVFYTRKDFPLLKVLNEKIEQLKAAGLVTFWQKNSLNIKTEYKEQESPKQLSFLQLSGCFEIFCIGCLLSTIVFISECIHFRVFKRNSAPI